MPFLLFLLGPYSTPIRFYQTRDYPRILVVYIVAFLWGFTIENRNWTRGFVEANIYRGYLVSGDRRKKFLKPVGMEL